MATKKEETAVQEEAPAADLPSVDKANVTTNAEVLATADAGEPSVGWTVQSDDHYIEADVKSEGAVSKDALPTKEGLQEAGVRDNDAYLLGVAVEGK